MVSLRRLLLLLLRLTHLNSGWLGGAVRVQWVPFLSLCAGRLLPSLVELLLLLLLLWRRRGRLRLLLLLRRLLRVFSSLHPPQLISRVHPGRLRRHVRERL